MHILLLLSLAHAVIGGRTTAIFPEVVKLRAGVKVCTGTIVGPRTVLSAGHCANDDRPFFEHKGKTYSVRFVKSPKQDIALAITSEDISEAKAAKLGSAVKHGTMILLAGFGCTEKGGAPGALHVGISRVVGMDDEHLLSSSKSALCEGDSGGPAFAQVPGGFRVVGVNSLSDEHKINVNVRTDSAPTREFLKTAAAEHRIEICGITSDCF